MDKPIPVAETDSGAVHTLLGELETCVEALLALPDIPVEPCHEVQEKIAAQTFNLVVAGEFKRGKTTLINALIGVDLLPVGVVPLTSVVTILSYGEKPSVQVILQNDKQILIEMGQLWDYVTEKGNPKNVKGVREVRITYPSAWLQGGVRLVDTPGIGSIYSHNTDVTYQFLPKADAVLFLLSVDQPLGKVEYDFLKEVGAYAGKIFFLLNKADLLSEADLQESIAFTRGAITETMGKKANLFPISARLALDGKSRQPGADEVLRRSRFPTFSKALNAFLMQERGNVLVGSIGRNLLRIVSQAHFNIELEHKSLIDPLDELNLKIQAFEAKKKEVLQSQDEYAILLDGEAKKLLETGLEDRLETFKQGLQREMTQGVERYFREHRQLSARKLYDALEQYVISQVKEAFDHERRMIDEEVAKAFDAMSARFIARINAMVDELFSFSSTLFAIPFDSVHAESISDFHAGFYYKFRSEPVGLQIMLSSVIFSLPRFIGNRWVLRKMLDYAVNNVDMQTGRVHYDLAQRANESVRVFKKEVLKKVETTIGSIDTAVHKGMQMRHSGEKEAKERGKELTDRSQTLEEIRQRLLSITQAAVGHDS